MFYEILVNTVYGKVKVLINFDYISSINEQSSSIMMTNGEVYCMNRENLEKAVKYFENYGKIKRL